MTVHLERGFSATPVEARNAPPGSIFLDGAAQGPPFVCHERGVYNLDHHEGCVRAFTLSACEQAMVLLHKGLDLRRRDWTVYANDADLDTVLAIWVLLNHLRVVHESPETAAGILPLLRLEGVIDALGREFDDLCALPPDLFEATRARMDRLREPELALKATGRWERVDLAEYVAGRLLAIDGMLFSPEQLASRGHVEELVRSEIAPGRIAIVCRSPLGVYEVERELRRLHGDRLGLFALRKGLRTYTLRQVDPSLPAGLAALYAQLNLIDPGSGGSVSPNRWGGSDEIGGSPRGAGTRMSPRQILEACRRAQHRPGWSTRLAHAILAGLAGAALLGTGLLPLLAEPVARLAGAVADLRAPHAAAATLVCVVAGVFLAAARRAPGLYGLRRPSGRDWWALAPVSLFAAASGGAWLPLDPAAAGSALASLPLWVASLLAVELVFRGTVHGIVARAFPIQSCGGRWFLSAPAVVSAALYAACTLTPLGAALPRVLPLPDAGLGAATPQLAAAFAHGLGLGVARERAESVLAPLLLHALCACALLLAP